MLRSIFVDMPSASVDTPGFDDFCERAELV